MELLVRTLGLNKGSEEADPTYTRGELRQNVAEKGMMDVISTEGPSNGVWAAN